jgi:DNA repair exonuclease SbcCD nuclease subunit
MIGLIHTGDWHSCPKHRDRFTAGIAALLQHGHQKRPDFFILTGDIFHGSVLMENPVVGETAMALKQMGEIAPVVGIYGTKSHDVPGILDTYAALYDVDSFPVFITHEPIAIAVCPQEGTKCSLVNYGKPLLSPPVAIVALLPPFSMNPHSAQPQIEAQERWVNIAQTLFTQAKEMDPEGVVPHILVAHISTDFCGPRVGNMVIPAAAIPAFDYVALGHEHGCPSLASMPNIQYNGSLFHMEANDLPKKALRYVTFNENQPSIELLPLPSRPYIDVTWQYPNGLPNQAELDRINATGAETIYVTIEVPADTLKEEVERELMHLRVGITIENVIVKERTIPPTKVRMPELAQRTTFIEKFDAWATKQVPPITITESLRGKAADL